MRVWMLAVLATLILVPGMVIADHHKDKTHMERGGNCSDARKQKEYFCDQSNAAQDSMVQIGTACNNAKNNVKAACEGVAVPDAEYKFDE